MEKLIKPVVIGLVSFTSGYLAKTWLASRAAKKTVSK